MQRKKKKKEKKQKKKTHNIKEFFTFKSIGKIFHLEINPFSLFMDWVLMLVCSYIYIYIYIYIYMC